MDSPIPDREEANAPRNRAIWVRCGWRRETPPAAATAAPALPPISACDDEVGRPRYHVIRSHAMAPIRPQNTTDRLSTSGFTTSLAIVAATFVPNTRNAMKLKKAAHSTARTGVRTRVATTVAIEFAASWKPLKKSNARATATTMTRPGVTMAAGSRVLEGDRLERAGHRPPMVEGPLERVDAPRRP